MGRPRVLLANDHDLLLGAFENLPSPECEIVGQVTDGPALIDAAAELRPDVIVLDISMLHLNGLEAGRRIKQALPDIRLIFVTMNEDSDLAAGAFRAGASAYLVKRSVASELATAIREVMHGRTYVTPLVTEGLVGSFMNVEERSTSHELTSRQREVLHLLAEGNSMKEAAAVLKLTPRTVAFHKYQMMEQLQIKSTAELIRYAVTHHIV
jgi:DNA-binding NarL/FixJ family response regulator